MSNSEDAFAEESSVTLSEKLDAIKSVVTFRPLFTVAIIVFGTLVAVLEGIGISFLVPIIQISRGSAQSADGLAGLFVRLFDVLGIPFVLEYVMVSVGVVMLFRYTSSYLVAYAREKLKVEYEADLRRRSFDPILHADIDYFDRHGTDDILNNIITQTNYAGKVVFRMVRLTEDFLIGVMYFSIALYLSPTLAIGTAVLLGTIMLVVRTLLNSGYEVGEKQASANEEIQTSIQTAIQGIRDIKLFNIADELYEDFEDALEQYVWSAVTIQRTSAAFTQLHNLGTTLVIFSLIYVALRFTSLELAELGVFLFAMFRLSPRVSSINSKLYTISTGLPHIVRTEEFIDAVESHEETDTGTGAPPETIESIEADAISFSYEETDLVLDDVSFTVDRGEFVAFVGPSGAGKSTIVSLLARFYNPDEGQIKVNGTSISEFELSEWRDKMAVVRQHPVIFNETLRYNLTVGNRNASPEEIERACELAQVTEFFDELPNGYDTTLGENGVRLSGGQRQRVALARALITDAQLLVLDEATSDLDTNIEADVQSGIESLEKEYTIITIAHRLSTVKNADKIYTLEDGEVIEVGTHEELIENDGTYADLYTVQSQEV